MILHHLDHSIRFGLFHFALCLLQIFMVTSVAKADGARCTDDVRISRLPLEGTPKQISTVGSLSAVTMQLASVGLSGEKVVLIDTSDPAEPQLIAEISNDPYLAYERVESLLTTDLLFIHESDTFLNVYQLSIYDISDPSNPTWRATMPITPLFGDMAFNQNHLYITGTSGLTSLDVSNPAAPTIVSTLSLGASASEIIIKSNTAFIGTYGDPSSGLVIVDVSDPTNPKPLGSYFNSSAAHEIAVSSDTLYLYSLNDRSIIALDITDRTAPTLIGTVRDGDVHQNLIREMDVDGDRLYAVDDDDGLLVFDVQDPIDPELLGRFDTAYVATDFTLNGFNAFVTSTLWDFEVVDIPRLTSPDALYATLPLPGTSQGVTKIDETLLIPAGPDGIHIVNVSNPEIPAYLGTNQTPANELVREGSLLYASWSEPAVTILDATDPTNLQTVGSIDIPGTTEISGIAIQGDLALLSRKLDLSLLLYFVDISDPASPNVINTYTLPWYAESIEISGNYAFLACSIRGIRVIDISDPITPHEAAVLDTFIPHELFLQNQTLYALQAAVFQRTPGLHIIDIQNPISPTQTAQFSTESSPNDLFVQGGHAYISTVSNGLTIVDVSDQSSPTPAGSHWAASLGLHIENEIAYTAMGTNGIGVIDVSDCDQLCVVDFNADGMLDFFDVSAFISAYTNEDLSADLNDDTIFDFFDISIFIQSYLAGCP